MEEIVTEQSEADRFQACLWLAIQNGEALLAMETTPVVRKIHKDSWMAQSRMKTRVRLFAILPDVNLLDVNVPGGSRWGYKARGAKRNIGPDWAGNIGARKRKMTILGMQVGNF